MVWFGITASPRDVMCRVFPRDYDDGTSPVFGSSRENYDELAPNDALTQYGYSFNRHLTTVCRAWEKHIHLGDIGRMAEFGIERPDMQIGDVTTLNHWSQRRCALEKKWKQ